MNLYVTDTMASARDCPMRGASDPVPAGHCWWGGEELQGRRLRWCSDACLSVYRVNHEWRAASWAARRRDGDRCRRCGLHAKDDANVKLRRRDWYSDGRDLVEYWPMEVNHVEPRRGAGYDPGCHHHLDGLETLCHRCHVAVTVVQLREWKYAGGAATAPGKPTLRDLDAEQLGLGFASSPPAPAFR
jgi:hypothetical protein